MDGFKRNASIDVAKGIGILLVVYAHIVLKNPVLNIIYGFHMPLFFILSGMVLNTSKYDTFFAFVKRRFWSLLIPYLMFSIPSIALWFFYNLGIAVISNNFSLQLVKTRLLVSLSQLVNILHAPYSTVLLNVPLWFVPCLFIVECLFFILYKSIKNRLLFLIVIVILVALGWFTESDLSPVDFSFLPWNIGSALFALGFFAIGNLTYKKYTQTVALLRGKAFVMLVAIIVCFAIEVPLAISNGHVTLGTRILNNGFILYTSAIFGSIAILLLSELLKNSKFLQFCGRSSFCIMGSHFIIKIIVTGFLRDVMRIESAGLKRMLIVFIITLIISLLFSVIYGRLKDHVIRKKSLNNL